MWTPKRVLLVIAGFALLFSSYSVYAHFLGGIDGLPPLPADYHPPSEPNVIVPPIKLKGSKADYKLRLAFGEQSQVLASNIKLEVPNKGIVLATHRFEIEKEGPHKGQARLEPFNIAIFGKPSDSGSIPEINTVSADVAYLEFDQPISSPSDMNSRKIIGGELNGFVEIVNNRRTPLRSDDLSLATQGPVFYKENNHKIWTDQPVKLQDPQSKPEPTVMSGVGMDVFLTTEPVPVKAQAAAMPKPKTKTKPETVSGVDRVVLRSTVEMFLWVDAKSGFLGANQEAKKPPTPANQSVAPAEKAKVVIRTNGPFCYDHAHDRATFDVPKEKGAIPEHVEVTRIHVQSKPSRPKTKADDDEQFPRDKLLCDHLELQFQRKSSAASDNKEDRGVDVEIESAHASGHEVTLSSESEGLDAFGSDMHYDARTRQTTLKGSPMKAIKDGHKIVAQEMCLKGTGQQKDPQQAFAKGPGWIDMFDRAADKYTVHANWKEELIFGKDGPYDCLTLTGDAAFEDQDHGQDLRAQKLKVWFKPAQASKAAQNDSQRLTPHHLEATGRVTADSPELHVKEPTDHLIIWFKDAPENKAGALPSAAAPAKIDPSAAGAQANKPAGKDVNGWVPAGITSKNQPAAPQDKVKKPIYLCARSVEAHVWRTGNKNELEKLYCDGEVRVRQEPGDNGDRGVDIRGDTLQLNHFPEGNVLLVTGNQNNLALVQLDKLTIQGPEVNIDQKTNNAWVNGLGAMQMPSGTNLSGESLKVAADITIHWNKDMFFNGNCAEFHGGVQAEQGGGRLACKEMQVFLDHPVSFKEGEKKAAPAKVKTLVCDQSVRLEEVTREGAKLVKYNSLSAPEVSMDNEEGVMKASGPGLVQVMQLGAAGDPLGKPNPPKQPGTASPAPSKDPPADELKLTRVLYRGHLHANNKTRTAIFYDGIEVIHVPTDNPNIKVDLEHLPVGAMHMRCEQLKVFRGQNSQEMEAHKRVTVRAREFWGMADVVKYDEGKDLVIFDGGEGGVATLYRAPVQGGTPEKITGRKILYSRRNGEFSVQGGKEIIGTPR